MVVSSGGGAVAFAERRNRGRVMERPIRHDLRGMGGLAASLLLGAAVVMAGSPADAAALRVRVAAPGADSGTGEELIDSLFLPADRTILQQWTRAEMAGRGPLQRCDPLPGQDLGIARRFLLPAGQAGAGPAELEGRGAAVDRPDAA